MMQAGSPAHQARVEVGTRDVCGSLGRPVENSRSTRVLVRPVVVEHLADPLCWQRSFQRQARHHAVLTANTSIQTVRDTGIDIAGEDPARLFAPGGAFRAASGRFPVAVCTVVVRPACGTAASSRGFGCPKPLPPGL
jgi:hypothetical protein